jgi:hypothetical protein
LQLHPAQRKTLLRVLFINMVFKLRFDLSWLGPKQPCNNLNHLHLMSLPCPPCCLDRSACNIQTHPRDM